MFDGVKLGVTCVLNQLDVVMGSLVFEIGQTPTLRELLDPRREIS